MSDATAVPVSTVAVQLATVEWLTSLGAVCFPVTRRTKGDPPLVQWGKFSAPLTAEEIVEHFGHELRNVGIATGPSGWVVVDEDRMRALADLAAQLGQVVPATLTFTTGRPDGRHHVFLAPDWLPTGIPNSNGSNPGGIAPGIDVKATGGMIVGPSSEHESGAIYGVMDPAIPPAPLPPWLAARMLRFGCAVDDVVTAESVLTALAERAARAASTGTAAAAVAPAERTPRDPWRGGHFTPEEAEKRVQSALSKVLASRHHGDGGPLVNPTLNSAALEIGHFVAGGFLTKHEAMERITECLLSGPGAVAGWTARNSQDETAIASGMAAGMTEPAGRTIDAYVLRSAAPAGESSPPTDADDDIDTWAPVDLGPYLRGEVPEVPPSIGVARTDGLFLLYPGLEHTASGLTESGKSWLGLLCCLERIRAGYLAIYVHFEESNPRSTIERLLLLGATVAEIAAHFLFIGPDAPGSPEKIATLAARCPSLVVFDGVNEGMSLHGQAALEIDGAATFRRRIVKPFTRTGAAVLSLDHHRKDADGMGRGPIGSVHKLNALDGASFVLETKAAFGRGTVGRSDLYVEKDRPGYLRGKCAPISPNSRTPWRAYLGTLIVDAQTLPGRVVAHISTPGAPDAAAANRELEATTKRDADIIAAVVELAPASHPEVYRAVGGRKEELRARLKQLAAEKRIGSQQGRLKGSVVYVAAPAVDQLP